MPKITKPLTKKEEQQVLSMFNGNKQRKACRNARTIAEQLELPRARVMVFLNNRGLTHYSESSYSNC